MKPHLTVEQVKEEAIALLDQGDKHAVAQFVFEKLHQIREQSPNAVFTFNTPFPALDLGSDMTPIKQWVENITDGQNP